MGRLYVFVAIACLMLGTLAGAFIVHSMSTFLDGLP